MDRILQPSEYVFDASAQTVAITLSSGGTVRLENLKLIINQTDNIIIFSSTNTSKQATLAGSTFTLEYDTTSMSDTDALKIIYYDQDYVNPVSVSGVSTSAKQDTIIGHVDGIETALTTLNAKDFATETTLAALLAKVIAAPSTEAKQDSMIVLLTAIAGYVDGLEAKDFATQTTLAQVLAKIIAAPATEAKQDTQITALQAIQAAAELLDNAISGNEMQVDVVTSALPTGASTAALQTTGNTALSAIQTAVQLIDNAVSGAGFNISQMNGVNVTMGNGASGTGVQRVTLASDSTGVVGLLPKTSGGLSIFRSIDLDESEEEVKATAGQVFGWYLFNGASSTLYVKLYNATAANVTVGTTTPVITIPVHAGAAANVEFTNGVAFSTAITAACTTGVADSDTGAPGANELIMNLFYK